jgi:hypothetical protein
MRRIFAGWAGEAQPEGCEGEPGDDTVRCNAEETDEEGHIGEDGMLEALIEEELHRGRGVVLGLFQVLRNRVCGS